MFESFLLVIFIILLIVLTVQNVRKDGWFPRRRERKLIEQTDRALESDPYLVGKIDRVREIIDGLAGCDTDDDNLHAMAIRRDYNALDDRFFDLYNENIAQMNKAEIFQELREIEKMAIDLKAQVDRIAELENERAD